MSEIKLPVVEKAQPFDSGFVTNYVGEFTMENRHGTPITRKTVALYADDLERERLGWETREKAYKAQFWKIVKLHKKCIKNLRKANETKENMLNAVVLIALENSQKELLGLSKL